MTNPQENMSLKLFNSIALSEGVYPAPTIEVATYLKVIGTKNTVTDVGVGDGKRLTELLLKAGVRITVGLEPHPEYYPEAKKNLPGVKVLCVDLFDLLRVETDVVMLSYGLFNMFTFEEQEFILRMLLLSGSRIVIDVIASPHVVKDQTVLEQYVGDTPVRGSYHNDAWYENWARENKKNIEFHPYAFVTLASGKIIYHTLIELR